MESKNVTYYPRLDQLRGLAVLLVMGFHIFHYFFHHWQPLSEKWYLGLISEGHTGIGLFFVLSGCIFTLIALGSSEIRYGQFIKNRFIRIFPLFLLIFFVSISIGRNQFEASDILYLFFSNLGSAPTSNSFVTGSAWTISIEFTFYFLFPFLFCSVKDNPYKKIASIIFIFFSILICLEFNEHL